MNFAILKFKMYLLIYAINILKDSPETNVRVAHPFPSRNNTSLKNINNGDRATVDRGNECGYDIQTA
jgi:hypothetical protein